MRAGLARGQCLGRGDHVRDPHDHPPGQQRSAAQPFDRRHRAGFLILPIGAVVLIRRRHTIDRSHAINVALCSAYASNAIFCLVGFRARNLGWYVTVVTVPAMVLVEITALYNFRRSCTSRC